MQWARAKNMLPDTASPFQLVRAVTAWGRFWLECEKSRVAKIFGQPHNAIECKNLTNPLIALNWVGHKRAGGTRNVHREPNIIKYQFKLTQQQFKPTHNSNSNSKDNNNNNNESIGYWQKIKLVQKCKHVVCCMCWMRTTRKATWTCKWRPAPASKHVDCM